MTTQSRLLSSTRLSHLQLSTQTAAALHVGTLGLIILSGMLLRFTALNRQSLWFDEVDVVVRAQQPLPDVLRTFVAAGENGPLYNILLALWIRIAGISEIAVRFPSAVAGTLAIPLLYLLARRIAGLQVGLVAAGLLAISPYHVWYSQEAKMYTLVVLLGLASTYALVEALLRNERWWWVAYGVVTTLMFYTHVATVLVFAAQTLYVIAAHRRWRGRERRWLAVAAFLTVPYLPIAAWAMRVIGGSVQTWQPDVSLWEAVRIFGTRFAIHRYDVPLQERAALLYALLAVGGLLALALVRQRERWWLLALALAVVPVVGLWAVSLRQSVFSDRYGIVALPAYLTLVAAALVWLNRRRLLWPLGIVALFFVVAIAWVGLRDVNRAHTAQKEDWRSAYAWIADRQQPGDALIVHPNYIITTHTYYSQREPRLEHLHLATIPTFRVRWLTESLMVDILTEQFGHPARIWLVQSPDRVPLDDPQQVLESWLRRTGTVRDELVVNGVRVTLFEFPSGQATGRIGRAADRD
jgi:mannosyltransferase